MKVLDLAEVEDDEGVLVERAAVSVQPTCTAAFCFLHQDVMLPDAWAGPDA